MHPATIILQLQTTLMASKANIGDITHEESLIQPQPAGNCINWVLGHLVTTRDNLLEALGSERVWSKAEGEPYDRHGPPLQEANRAKLLAEIWQALETSQQRLAAAISPLTPEQLAQKSAFSPTGNPDETLGSLLAIFGFHDAYHAGQTGILRRIIGKPPRDL